WIGERLAERTDDQAALEKALDAKRRELADLDVKRERRMAELENVGFHPVALEAVERIDQQREALETLVSDAEARLGEWSAAPGADAVLDWYTGIRDLVTGKIAKAAAAGEVATALRDVLAGVWMELCEPDYVPLHPGEKVLRAEFALRRQLGGTDLLSLL